MKMRERGEQTVPNRESPLPPGPWLVFSAHADDECVGMGGTLLRGARAGVLIRWVILTDGTRGGPTDERDMALREVREREAMEVADGMGIPKPEFWRLADGELAAEPELADRVAALVREIVPGTVFFPSRLDFHPDHRAAAEIVWAGILASGMAVEAWAYGLGNGSPVNRLIRITEVLGERRKLIGSYRSQLLIRPYDAVADGISIVRGYTLGTPGAHAEGFHVYEGRGLTTLTAELIGGLQGMLVPSLVGDPPLVSVILRTVNRPESLARALQSVLCQGHPRIQVVVVNDGGVDVAGVVEGFRAGVERLDLVTLERNRGRGGAGNAGLETVVGEWVAFLDDDDVWKPDHLETLVKALRTRPGARAAYTGVEMEGPEGARVVNQPYNRAWLQLLNLFPIHAALFSREFAKLGCRFDEELEVFEDHDFWIQITELTDWIRVPGCTALYSRGGTSGVSADGLDAEKCRRAEERIASRWRSRWRREDLVAQAELGRRLYKTLDADHLNETREHWSARRRLADQLCDRTLEAERLRQQVLELEARVLSKHQAWAALVGSTSYRVGRAITAPVRWILGWKRRAG